RGHEEASGTKYVPKDLMDFWAAKDPLSNFENYLLAEGLLDQEQIEKSRKTFKTEINRCLKIAYDEPISISDEDTESTEIYAPLVNTATTELQDSSSSLQRELRFIDAISEGLRIAMERHEKLVLMGQDIADYGGVFKITDGFTKQFGKGRVRNTPLCESAIVGAGLGLSLKGWKAMVEMQFADFASCGFNQIVNNLAKLHYRWGQNADVVIRMPTGGGMGAGPFHSQSNEAWFTHTPGLKVVYPSTPSDAKGLLLASFEDPNPVLFFEHKALYRSLSEEVTEDFYTIPIGKAKIVKEGNQATIITYGLGVHWAKKLVDSKQMDIEIIDLMSLQPIDYDTIEVSIRKTHRVLLLHEDTLFGGIGGEISAHISEHLFEYLDAPIMRVASLDTPVPFAKSLEAIFLGEHRLQDSLTKLLNY
ncbi:MAG: transketolase C-terminal domain-containing protein, partial [Bacteroidota bacterium]